jgi:outer membrane autotransporter protein
VTTALVSTLVIGSLFAPSPASAQTTTCTGGPAPGPTPILEATAGPNAPIICVNSDDRVSNATSPDAINLSTAGTNSFIDLYNSGFLTADEDGVDAITFGNNSPVAIQNRGDIVAGDDSIYAESIGDDSGIVINNEGALNAGSNGPDYSAGIYARTFGDRSTIEIANSGSANGVYGILALTYGVDSGITVSNTADIVSVYGGVRAFSFGDRSENLIINSGNINSVYFGVSGHTEGDYGDIQIVNSGDITVTNTTGFFFAIGSLTTGRDSDVSIFNSGDLEGGLNTITFGDESGITIINNGDIETLSTQNPFGFLLGGLSAISYGEGSDASLTNSGDITSTHHGIDAHTHGGEADITIANAGDIDAGDFGPDYSAALYAITHGAMSDIGITNSGDLQGVYGIRVFAYGANSDIAIANSGDINANYGGIRAFNFGGDFGDITILNSGNINSVYIGLSGGAEGAGDFRDVTIVNSGDITVTSNAYGGVLFAIGARTDGDFSDVSITNSGNIDSASRGISSVTFGFDSDIAIMNSGAIEAGYYGITARSFGGGSQIDINNSGVVYGAVAGVETYSLASSMLINSGSISAGTGLAIDTNGASSTILNSGVITGFVDLTDNPDLFVNQKGGTVEARLTSDFGGGFDTFENRGTVHTASDPSTDEFTSFVNLELFENRGLISLVDGAPGDVFLISGPSLTFEAKGKSTLAVDADLGGPGSTSDILSIEGDVDGRTRVVVNNTSAGGGAPNQEGITVVQVTGAVDDDAFFLKGGPVDAGFFDYQLFFEPGATNIFELRSALGAGAFVLPQLTTAMQDLFHATSHTALDRTADLRAALYGGHSMNALPAAAGFRLGPATIPPPQGYAAIYPAIWARGSIAGLDRDGSVNTQFGTGNLDREQDVADFQVGIDGGGRDVFAPGDALIFGLLGGFVFSELEYDKLARSFDIEGGQAGVYVTYLRGGLFVDTLFKADFVEIDPNNSLGFAGSLDAHNLGARLDSGYRFGGFKRGLFLEPLATISVVKSDIDSFRNGVNQIRFEDGTSVRGRLGLRAGTTFAAGAITVEPFVIGSVWHEFEDDNRAQLTSLGTTFNLLESLDDTWGEVSGGINLFSLGGATSGFLKVDVVFGDDIEGVGGQVGARYKW